MLLRKKIYQISLTAIFIAGSLFVVNIALAQTAPPNPGNLIVNFNPDPLFNADNFLPGDVKIGEAEVINNTEEIKKIATEAINYPVVPILGIPGNDLSRAMTIIIKEKNNNDIYGGNSGTGEKMLFEFYENGETYLSDVGGNSSKTFQFIISFPEDKGDDWQDTTTEFDIIVGFQGEGEGITPPGTNHPGGVGGNLPQGLTILDQSVKVTKVGETSAAIIWTTSYLSTSQVVYSSQIEYNNGHTFDLAKPNYGYFSATPEKDNALPINEAGHGVIGHTVFINGLSSETTYHFRCVSHASPPTISRTHTFTTLALAKTDEASEPLNNPVEKIYDENKPAAENGLVPVAQEQNIEENADNKKSGKNIITKSLRKMASSVKNITGAVLGEETKKENFLNNDTDNSKFSDNTKTTDKSQNQSKYYIIGFFIILLLIILAVLFYFFRKNRNQKIY